MSTKSDVELTSDEQKRFEEACEAIDEGNISVVTPTKFVEDGDSSYDYRHTFTKAYIGDIPDITRMTGRVYKNYGDYVVSCYKDEPPIVIDQYETHMVIGSNRKESKKQAYFAIGILASDGLVGGFTQNG